VSPRGRETRNTEKRVAVIYAKFQVRQRRYQPNLTFYIGGYDYWRLWILAGTVLVVLKFGVCGCPEKPGHFYPHSDSFTSEKSKRG